MNLEDTGLSETSQTQKNKWSHIYAESKKVEFIGESSMVVARGWEVREMGKCQSKSTNFQLWVHAGDLMYSKVTTVNTTILYSNHVKWLVFISLPVVIIDIRTSNYHVVHLIYIQFSFVNYISVKLGEKCKKKKNYLV